MSSPTLASEATADRLREWFQAHYRELKRLAHNESRRNSDDALHTTTLLHEAYLKFQSGAGAQFEDRRHFFAYACHVMRSIVVDHARLQLTKKRAPGATPITLDTEIASSLTASNEDIIRVHEALGDLATFDERLAQIVEMKYFAGLKEDEIADVLEISTRTVQREWEKARLLLLSRLTES